MFRKIVSNLPFSPTLIGELGFYAKRLRKEEATRRLGLIFTALALVVQSMSVFSPPESANAANASDLISGGLHSRSAMLSAWDNNSQGFRELAQHAGISRENLANAKDGHTNTRTNGNDNGWITWGRVSRGGAQFNETSFSVGNQTIYQRNLAGFDTGNNTRGTGSWYPSFVGTNTRGETFAIQKDCGNIMLKRRVSSDKNIKVCEINSRTIVTIRESAFSNSRHSKNLQDCETKRIQVCEVGSRTIITIDEREYSSSRHSKNLDDCKSKPIQVCDLSSRTITTIDERQFNSSRHSRNISDCQPKMIEVCQKSTYKIVRIDERDFNSSLHSRDLDNCKPKPIQVCDKTSRQIITIETKDYNSTRHSLNQNDCKPKPIQVCDIASTMMITIDERDFNQQKHSKNPEDCKPKPVPAANCSSLIINKLSRTEFELKSAATVKNGATIKSYTYVIKDKSGKEVLRKTINSGVTSNTLKHKLPEGDYRAELIVATSVGDRTATACKVSFNIAPVERCPLNPELAINDPDCQPCIGDPTIWVRDENCVAKVISSKKAVNLTANKPAQEVKAQASDRIEYKLTATNEGKEKATVTVKDDLSDSLEYSKIYDRGGGSLDDKTKVLSWADITLDPGQSKTFTYVLQMDSTISVMPRGTSSPASYDCTMVNVFGNTIKIEVECPAPKVIEKVVPELPRTGPTANIIAGAIVAAVVTFLYARSRQLGKEVRLIRRETAAGAI